MKLLQFLTIVNVASASLPKFDGAVLNADVQLSQATLSIETKLEDKVNVTIATLPEDTNFDVQLLQTTLSVETKPDKAATGMWVLGPLGGGPRKWVDQDCSVVCAGLGGSCDALSLAKQGSLNSLEQMNKALNQAGAESCVQGYASDSIFPPSIIWSVNRPGECIANWAENAEASKCSTSANWKGSRQSLCYCSGVSTLTLPASCNYSEHPGRPVLNDRGPDGQARHTLRCRPLGWDTNEPMCAGGESPDGVLAPHGQLYISETEMQARCTADPTCAGYGKGCVNIADPASPIAFQPLMHIPATAGGGNSMHHTYVKTCKADDCRNWCAGHTLDWPIKCVFATRACSACSECQAFPTLQ